MAQGPGTGVRQCLQVIDKDCGSSDNRVYSYLQVHINPINSAVGLKIYVKQWGGFGGHFWGLMADLANCSYHQIASLLLNSYHTQKGNDFSVREGFKKKSIMENSIQGPDPPPGYGKKNFIFFSETRPFFENFL